MYQGSCLRLEKQQWMEQGKKNLTSELLETQWAPATVCVCVAGLGHHVALAGPEFTDLLPPKF